MSCFARCALTSPTTRTAPGTLARLRALLAQQQWGPLFGAAPNLHNRSDVEGAETVAAFFDDMKRRGLNDPLLVIKLKSINGSERHLNEKRVTSSAATRPITAKSSVVVSMPIRTPMSSAVNASNAPGC